MGLRIEKRAAKRLLEEVTEAEREEARAPATSQARLRHLFDNDPSLDSFLVQNPNLPRDLLFKLGEQHPEAMLANPGFALCFLEVPGAIHEVPTGTLASLARLVLPSWLIELICSRRGELFRLVSIRDTSPNFMERVFDCCDSHSLGGLASNPNAPTSLLERILQQKDLRRYVAGNRSLSVERLTELASDPDEEVRAGVARNKSAPLSLLDSMRSDPWWEVRATIAERKDIPALWLEALATDEEARVREHVLKHPGVPVHVAAKLFRDESALVRSRVAKHPEMSAEILVALSLDTDDATVREALSNPNMPVEAALQRCAENATYREALAANPSIPLELFEAFVQDPSNDVRASVADNKSVPTFLLERLASDPEEEVRFAVAFHRNAPEAVLRVLANDPEYGVRAVAADRLERGLF